MYWDIDCCEKPTVSVELFAIRMCVPGGGCYMRNCGMFLMSVCVCKDEWLCVINLWGSLYEGDMRYIVTPFDGGKRHFLLYTYIQEMPKINL